MAKTLAHGHHHVAHRASHRASHLGGGGIFAALLVVAVLAAAVWGAWRLGVMAGDQVDWRQGLVDAPALLRKTPNPPPIPTQRRPAVAGPMVAGDAPR